MLNANWKKKIGIGQPIRYGQAAAFGIFSTLLFAVFALILVKQNRAIELPVFAMGYFVATLAIQVLCCVLDAEQRLQPIEDKIHAYIFSRAKKLKTQKEAREPDPTILDDAMEVINYDIEKIKTDPDYKDYLVKELVPHHEQRLIEETLDGIRTQSTMRGMQQPFSHIYTKPLPTTTREYARETVKQEE